MTWKSIGVTCAGDQCPYEVWIPGLSVLELSSGNHFTASGHCDLDLWPSDLKINRGHLPVMTNVPMKFRDPRPKRSWVIIRKPFYCSSGHCDLDLWPSDLKINRGHLPVMTNVPMKFHDPRRKRSWVIIRKPFSYFQSTILLLQVTVTLTFDLVTWKSIGVICRSWPMSLWSFVIPGVSVLELSSGNHFPISSHCDLDLWPWPLT